MTSGDRAIAPSPIESGDRPSLDRRSPDPIAHGPIARSPDPIAHDPIARSPDPIAHRSIAQSPDPIAHDPIARSPDPIAHRSIAQSPDPIAHDPIARSPDSPPVPAIQLDGVTKRYGRTTALDGVSLAVAAGEMFGLIGPDGAGKTTAIRAVCGLIAIDGGRIRILEKDPVRDHRVITGAVGYLSQRFSLYGDLTIDENIAFFAEIHGLRSYAAARDRLLEMTQLTRFRARRADRLSGGMKQKLALACTLVHEPRVLLLDEPTTGVDPVSRREFWKLLSEFMSSGLTIVMATPYLDEAERCGRVALLHEGRLLAIDTPATLRRGLAGQMVEVVTNTPRPPLDALAALPGVADVQAFGERAHVRVTGSGAPDAQAAAIRDGLSRMGIDVVAARSVGASLEDVFIDLITPRLAAAATETAGK